MRDLFSKAPEYTIDTSSLIEIFNVDTALSKSHLPGLWERILEMLSDGRIISHAEVLAEIQPGGDELSDWARANSGCFKEHSLPEEGLIIGNMSARYKAFVNAKVKSVHADPWLIAQAKCLGLSLITEETISNSPDPTKARIPNVCCDPAFNVPYVNLIGLIKAKAWSFR